MSLSRTRSTAADSFLITEEEVWAQAPGFYRAQVRSFTHEPGAGRSPRTPPRLPSTVVAQSSVRHDTQPPGVASPDSHPLVITDGAAAWQYEPESKRVTRLQGAASQIARSTLTAVDLGAFRGDPSYLITLGQEAIIAGRPTLVVELVPQPRPGTFDPLRLRRVQIWIDREFYLPLRSEVRDLDGNLLIERTFTSVEANPSIDASLFRFTPPPDAQVVESSVQGATAVVSQPEQWQRVADLANFQVFQPTNAPAGLIAGQPMFQVFNGLVAQRYSVDSGSGVLHLEQGPISRARGQPNGQSVTIGGLRGWYWEDARWRWLVFDRDGTRIELRATLDLSKDILWQLATSLGPVSGSKLRP